MACWFDFLIVSQPDGSVTSLQVLAREVQSVAAIRGIGISPAETSELVALCQYARTAAQTWHGLWLM